MNEKKEFDSDEIIVQKTPKIVRKFNLKEIFSDRKEEYKYINSFGNYRKIIEYGMCIHFSLNFTFWLQDNYGGKMNESLKSNKLLFTFGIFCFGLTFIDDIIYVLFKKQKEDGFFKKILQYERKILFNFKYSCSNLFFKYNKNVNKEILFDNEEKESNLTRENSKIKDDKEKSQLALFKIHSDLRELERKEKELREKIKNIPLQDISYVEILKEINSKNEKKRKLIQKLR
jgi:hypothetical protein